MMDKYCDLSGRDDTGHPLIHVFEPGSKYGLQESGGLQKVASGEHLPQVMELVESIQAQPDRLYLINSALGAGEWVGFNLRGDWFTERGLLHEPYGWNDIPVWDIDARRRAAAQTEPAPGYGNLAWGYPTFYNAHRFQHHVNQKSDKARGYILGAFYDHRMHRVVLVSELIRSKCAEHGGLDVYARIERGDFPDTSIGIKVPSDVCSVCGHVAAVPEKYCEHVHKDAPAPYGMRAILPDGRRCGVYNHYPRGFDDSFVFIGAERSAKVMANVTQQVRGNRAYTDKWYLPGQHGGDKTAGASAATPFEQEAQLARALDDVERSRVAGPIEKTVAANISRVLSSLPVVDEKEKKAVEHAERAERRRAAVADRTMSNDEFRFWDDRQKSELRGHGVERDHTDRALANLRERMNALGTPKLGSLAKWATMTKEVPVPTSAQSALVRDHVSRLSAVRPQVLDDARSPDDLWALLSQLAHLGVVLRPQEFQDSMLGAMGQPPSDRDFAPTPLDPEQDSPWRPSPPDPSLIARLVELLGSSLPGRSFAPRMVVVRIMSPPAPAQNDLCRIQGSDPILNRISQMYNDYRNGLITHAPDYGYVPAPLPTSGSAKLADAASAVSSLLLHLAFR